MQIWAKITQMSEKLKKSKKIFFHLEQTKYKKRIRVKFLNKALQRLSFS